MSIRLICLGGHSTGGTLVMLAAEASPVFRASFAFGPVTSPERYPTDWPRRAGQGVRGRADAARPGTGCRRSPPRLLVIEGEGGNIGELRAMQRINRNPASPSMRSKG